MISEELLEELASLDGYLSKSEGRALAELAREVRADQAILEVGSFKGKSACFLGAGSRLGESAPIFAVDLWELHASSRYASPDVFRRWCEQIARMDLTDLITPIRAESSRYSELFSHPIGLLFIDGNHEYDVVAEDFRAWSPKVADGGIVAFHDYGNSAVGEGVTRFVDRQVATSADWRVERVVDSLCIVRRAKSDLSPEERLVYVENEELERHLATRPPQYPLELSPIVPKRDEGGIYVDTQSPEYVALQEKYRGFRLTAKPVETRVGEICKTCPVGAKCRFPRLSVSEQKEILESKDRDSLKNWCETKAFGGKLDFVYTYVSGPARGDELKYSLRSLEKNFVGTPRVWIVGDRPDWYQGNHIPHQRVPPCRYRPRLDQAAKFKKVAREKRIRKEFVWMMDDIYLLRPITLEELRRPLLQGAFRYSDLDEYAATNDWRRCKQITWEALKAEGYPVDDATTHTPRLIKKKKLRRLLKKYRLDKNPYIIDLLYCNVYATSLPSQSFAVRHIDDGSGSAADILKRSQSALMLNHPDQGYTPAMEEALEELFPEPSPWESP